MDNKTASAVKAAAKECFVDRNTVAVSLFIKALQTRNVVTKNKLTRIIESTDYLALANHNNVVKLTKNTFAEQAEQVMQAKPTPLPKMAAKSFRNTIAPSVVVNPPPPPVTITRATLPLSVNCDTDAIVDVLGDIAIEHLDLEDTGVTDIFIDVGSSMSVKVNGQCVQRDKVIEHPDVAMILQNLPGGGPTVKQSNRVIFGQTLHRLAAVMYDGIITGVTIRVGRSVSGLLPLFEGLVEQKNVLLCGAPNVGKTTTLREICKYLSRGKCLCLIDTSGEVCGDAGNKDHIVGTSRVFRPVDPDNQYATLLDCVRNHSPDVIAIDELNTKGEVDVCQTIALRSIQMVASVHGNIQDLVFNPMLNKALGGSTQALVSDRNAVDGRKVVVQRTSRPIFDLVINIKRTSEGLEYAFIEDVAENVSRIMQGKPIQTRTRRIVGEELIETTEEVLYPHEC
ncbi:hypothetical protein BGZ80_008095 [Entomortierella chlamydospora]|uniref:AAA+ ATPase domain-containing protein n=1 Tax=Entomortierella chlamydospora TaxID=101097 RepID=A0A9P6N3U0_9FUNG|nr:hypothetical protein BGZ80_008095 [Entomortierella chlamydospora]